MDIQDILRRVIPPNTRDYREGFQNNQIIDQLNDLEKSALETALIAMLPVTKDPLIIETLAYMKSSNALPALYDKLVTLPDMNLTTAVCIFEINADSAMIDVALDAARKIASRTDPYRKFSLIYIFFPLSKFKHQKINAFIEQFINDDDFLIAYNAKRFLGLTPP